MAMQGCGGGMVKANEEDTARCSIRRAARALSCGGGGGGGILWTGGMNE